MKNTALFFLFIFTQSIFGDSTNELCLTHHVQEAIEVNRERINLYKELEDDEKGKGLGRLFSQYILFEKIMIPFSKNIDKKAYRFQRLGIPVICNDMISMEEIDEFAGFGKRPEVAFELFPKKFLYAAIKDIKKLLKNDMYTEAYQLTVTLIKLFEVNKNYNCLQRHFLESIARTLNHSIKNYFEMFDHSKDLKSFKKFLNNYIDKQFLSVKWSRYFDKRAGKYQEDGLKLFCQDIPHIPYI